MNNKNNNNNGLNLSPEKLDVLINIASKKLGTSPQNLKDSIQSGNLKNATMNMTPQAAEKFNRITSNPKEIEKIMNNPQVQELIKKLSEGKK